MASDVDPQDSQDPQPPSGDPVVGGAALVRGLCGGFLFAVPIIYTMEVWWLGHSLVLWKVLAILGLGFVLALGLNYYSGFREDTAWPSVLQDAVTSLGIGFVVAFVMLFTMGVITTDSTPSLALRQITVLAVPISFGVSIARSQFVQQHRDQDDQLHGWRADLRDLGLTVFGGAFIGLSIAPTEEVLVIVTQSNLWRLLVVMALSLLLSYGIIFVAEFYGQELRRETQGAFQSPLAETFASYVVSLGVSLALVLLIGFTSGDSTLWDLTAMVVVLGLPVTLGGAAARLLI
jgi:putative integral membrane protein (TIGR02587 family)